MWDLTTTANLVEKVSDHVEVDSRDNINSQRQDRERTAQVCPVRDRLPLIRAAESCRRESIESQKRYAHN